jgi:hypothetical protein
MLLVKMFALTTFVGLLCGLVIGGLLNKPWWYVFPISLVGGLVIGWVVGQDSSRREEQRIDRNDP